MSELSRSGYQPIADRAWHREEDPHYPLRASNSIQEQYQLELRARVLLVQLGLEHICVGAR